MRDTNGKEIKAGDRLRHTTHGGICRVCEPGADSFLSRAEGLILIPIDMPHRTGLAWHLTEKRASKGEVVV
jgi:hypothetical protein